MCGFAGEVRRDGPADAAAVARMAEVLAPRGPDGQGLWQFDGVCLGHRRLAIIDLTEHGAQPMIDVARGLAVAFNGCIYNHRELKAELEALGAAFFSDSDTEVVLRAYDQWGAACVERFYGMFAFAIHERASGRVVLARDRLGIKPLYVTDVGGAVRFASTLPALLAGGGVSNELDPVALHHYLSWHAVVPAPRTILRDVRKIAPATVVTLERDGTRTEQRYWEPSFMRDATYDGWSAEQWEEAVLDATRTAVKRRTRSDVPVGVLLSGGLDSSLIVALLAELGVTSLQTFSIGFDAHGGRTGDEFQYSDIIAAEFATDHHQIHIATDRMLPNLTRAIASMSEPMTSHDCVAFYLLAQEVSRSVKVVQSGQGADEVFGGYDWYQGLSPAEDAPPGAGFSDYEAKFFDRSHAELNALLAPELRLPDSPSDAFATEWFSRPGASSVVDRALRLDTQIMLTDDPVKRVDNMTMAHGLELRTPFLDHELVELAGRVPPALKLAGDGKGVLKEAGRRVLPDAVIDRPKGYFPVPALKHLEGGVLELIGDALTSGRARQRTLFDRAWIDRLLAAPNDHYTRMDGNVLWQLGALELWLQQHGL